MPQSRVAGTNGNRGPRSIETLVNLCGLASRKSADLLSGMPWVIPPKGSEMGQRLEVCLE